MAGSPLSLVRFSPGFDRSLQALAEAVFASDRGPLDPNQVNLLADDVRDFLTHAGARSRTLFQLSLWFTDWIAAPLTAGARLRTLPWARRVQVLADLETRDLFGLPVLLMKTILSATFFDLEIGRGKIGDDRRPMRSGES